MVEVHADLRGRTLGKRDHRGTHDVERRDVVVALGVLDDHGVARGLGGVDRSTDGLEARRVERRDGHVVLLGDGADVTKVDKHGGSFLSDNDSKV